MCGGLSARRVKVLSWRHRGRGHRCGPAWRRDLALVDSVPDEIIGCRVDQGGNDAQVSERLDPRREIRHGEGGLRRIVRASGEHRRDERSHRLADHDQDCNLDDDIGGIASQQEHPAPLVLNREGEEHGGKAAYDHPDEQDDQEVVEGARHRRLRGWVARDDARGYGKGEGDNGHGSNDDADNEQEDGQENVSRMGGAEGFPPEDHQDRADEDQDRTNDSDDRKPPDERADEQEQDPGLRPANLGVTLGLHRGGEPRRAHVHRRGRRRHATGPFGQGAPAVRTEHRSRTIRRATTRTVDASGQVAPPAAECGTRLKSISKAGKAYSTRDEWWPVGGTGGFDRWISFELGRLNAGLVIEKRSLAALLKEPEPAARTREGDVHPFEPQVLARFASVLTRDEADALRLPLTLTVRGDSDEAILTDEIGAKALRTLENFGQAFRFRDGRMALPHSLAIDLTRRYGGVLQLAFGRAYFGSSGFSRRVAVAQ